jgi:hypothetical protein
MITYRLLISKHVHEIGKHVKMTGGAKTFSTDNPTRKFLTNGIAAFFKFGPIKLIYSEKTPSRVKKQPAE